MPMNELLNKDSYNCLPLFNQNTWIFDSISSFVQFYSSDFCTKSIPSPVEYSWKHYRSFDSFDRTDKQIQYQTLLYFCNIVVVHTAKEYIERRHGEPFKFLFLPKIGLLGSQAVLEKKVQFLIMSNFLALFFQLFMGKNLFFWNFNYIVASALKSCLIKKLKKIEKNFGRFFLGLKTVFFRASCFGLFWF